MNARTPEGFPSVPSPAPSDKSLTSPSDYFVDALMEGPRVWAAYFTEQIALRFPTEGYDAEAAKQEEVSLRTITNQLRSYEHHWLKKYIAPTLEEYRDFEPEEERHKAAYSELTFHLINRYTMPHWYRAFTPQQSPKLDPRSLNAAQINLALESAALLRFQRSKEAIPEEGDYTTPQLKSLDTMIGYLQLMIDAEFEDLDPNSVVTLAPLPPYSTDTPPFLLFTSNDTQNMQMRRLLDVEQGERTRHESTPGHIARVALTRTKISTLSSWPEFSSRSALHTFMTARSTLSKTDADDPAIENLRQELGEGVRKSLF